jgi:ubiquinone/menaquinone biosynthesis C-methylase UbiE
MGEEAQSGKNWSRVAALYAKSVNENDPKSASGAACTEILKAVDEKLPFSEASFIVDMGCGNGQVISRVFDSSKHAEQIPDNARLLAVDVSQHFVDMVKERKKERKKQSMLWERLKVHRWDARDLRDQIHDGEVSHLLASFAYFSMDGEHEALAEAHRILKDGGIFVETSMGMTEWGHLPQFVKQVRPDLTVPEIPANWSSVDKVINMLSGAGFKNVVSKEFEVGLPLERYDDAVQFVFEGFPRMKPVLEDMSSEEIEKARQLMLEYVKEKHPQEPFRLIGKGYVGYGVR